MIEILRIAVVIILSIVLIFNLFLLVLLLISLMRKVPYVPSGKKQVDAMVKIAKITAKDSVCDLGCGHGTLLFAAEKATKAKELIGYESAPLPLFINFLVRLFKKTKVKILNKNFFKEDLSKYSVVLLYLLPETMDALLPKLKKELKKGTRIISNSFQFKDLKPKKVYTEKDIPGIRPIYEYEL